MYQFHCVRTSTIVSHFHCVTSPLSPSPDVFQSHSQYMKPVVSQSHYIPCALCSRYTVYQYLYVPIPLCTSTLCPTHTVYQYHMSQSLCVPVPCVPITLCTSTMCPSHTVPVPYVPVPLCTCTLCPNPIVSHSHCVPVPCVPLTLCTSTMCPTHTVYQYHSFQSQA